jgi:hypothetical protein
VTEAHARRTVGAMLRDVCLIVLAVALVGGYVPALMVLALQKDRFDVHAARGAADLDRTGVRRSLHRIGRGDVAGGRRRDLDSGRDVRFGRGVVGRFDHLGSLAAVHARQTCQDAQNDDVAHGAPRAGVEPRRYRATSLQARARRLPRSPERGAIGARLGAPGASDRHGLEAFPRSDVCSGVAASTADFPAVGDDSA